MLPPSQLLGLNPSRAKLVTGGRSFKRGQPPESYLLDFVVDVQMCGATGDGTTDDTAAFESAINLASASGAIVWVPGGTYLIDALTSIVLPSESVLWMSPQAVLKAKPNGMKDYSIIKIWGVRNVTVLGGTVQGERSEHIVSPDNIPDPNTAESYLNHPGESGFGVDIRNSANVTIERVTARDCWGDGFLVSYFWVASSYKRWALQTGTALHETDDTFEFAVAPNRDLFAIKKSKTDSQRTEVHVLSADSNYQEWALQTGTALHETDDTFEFAVAPNRDLFAIKKSKTDSQRTEVHILSAASNYQKWVLQTGTALHETDGTFAFAVAPNRDLFAIKKSKTDSDSTEVHVLSADSSYQEWALQTKTPLPKTDDTFEFAVADNRDLFAIAKSKTDSNSTEVHVLSADKDYQEWVSHAVTALHVTDDTFEFALAPNRDLFAIKKSKTGSQSTEVHVLSVRGDSSNCGNSSNVRILNCLADNNRRQGCSITGLVGGVIDGCVFTRTNGTAPQSGIDVEPDAKLVDENDPSRAFYPEVRDVRICNCSASDNVGYGIELTAAGNGPSSCIISGNTCRGNQSGIGVRITLDERSDPAYRDGQIIVANNICSLNRESGIEVGATDVVVLGNICHDNAVANIMVKGEYPYTDAGARNCGIQCNIARGSLSQCGLLADAKVRGILVANNDLRGSDCQDDSDGVTPPEPDTDTRMDPNQNLLGPLPK
jgi:hypothetical protein